MGRNAEHPLSIFLVIQAFLLFITLQFFAGPLLFLLGYSWKNHIPLSNLKIDNPEMAGWVSALSILTTLIGMLIMFRMQPSADRQAVWFSIGQSHRPWYWDILYGIGTCLLAYPIVLFFNTLTTSTLAYFGIDVNADQIAVRQVKEILNNIPLLLVLGSCVCFLVPIVEELLFRGYLQQWFKGYVPLKLSIIFTSVCFASVHFSWEQGMSNIPLLSALFILSLILGYIREERGSLWASIGIHSFFNLIGILLILTTA